ncbi:MAG: hypothetical protein ABI387_15530 [Lacunisphaera sp.]
MHQLIESLPIRLIPGGMHRDARGALQHVNAFSFGRVDRFYSILPANPGEVRGWVGHRRDWKWFFATKGEFKLGAVRPRDWTHPAPDDAVDVFSLREESPCVLEVPPGHFTAACALELGSALLVFSSGGIEDSAGDDCRLPPDFWGLPSSPRTAKNRFVYV